MTRLIYALGMMALAVASAMAHPATGAAFGLGHGFLHDRYGHDLAGMI